MRDFASAFIPAERPPSSGRPTRHTIQTAKMGGVPSETPLESRRQFSRNSVKLRLTLSTARKPLISTTAGPFSARAVLKRARRPPGLVTKALNEGLGSIESRQPRLHIAQTLVIRLAVVRSERQFGVLKFPS
jgi:hypothetical protein